MGDDTQIQAGPLGRTQNGALPVPWYSSFLSVAGLTAFAGLLTVGVTAFQASQEAELNDAKSRQEQELKKLVHQWEIVERATNPELEPPLQRRILRYLQSGKEAQQWASGELKIFDEINESKIKEEEALAAAELQVLAERKQKILADQDVEIARLELDKIESLVPPTASPVAVKRAKSEAETRLVEAETKAASASKALVKAKLDPQFIRQAKTAALMARKVESLEVKPPSTQHVKAVETELVSRKTQAPLDHVCSGMILEQVEVPIARLAVSSSSSCRKDPHISSRVIREQRDGSISWYVSSPEGKTKCSCVPKN